MSSCSKILFQDKDNLFLVNLRGKIPQKHFYYHVFCIQRVTTVIITWSRVTISMVLNWKSCTYFLIRFDNIIQEMTNMATNNYRKHKLSYQQDRSLHKVKSVPFILKRKFSRQSTDTEMSLEAPTVPKGVQISDFVIVRSLGKGISGQVMLAIHKETGFLYAIKKIPKKTLTGTSQPQTSKIRTQLLREIKLQAFMCHQNLIKLYHIFHDPQNIYLVMQAATDGHLYSLLSQENRPTEQTTSYIVKQILEGIEYMHEREIIHRDVKLENILLSFGMVKLCDFGWSVHCSKEIRSTICGTPLYFSPQLLQGKQYDKKVDVWSIGIITHELITGQNPFHIKRRQQLSKIVTEEFEMKIGSHSLKHFVEAALEKNPQKRVSVRELLRHPFIGKYRGLVCCDQLNQIIARN